jgi:hypothetical protein
LVAWLAAYAARAAASNACDADASKPRAVRFSASTSGVSGRVLVVATNDPLIGSVGFFPERYGAAVICLAIDLLGRRSVPPAIFVKHQLITRDNVDQLYPNDGLLGVERFARF